MICPCCKRNVTALIGEPICRECNKTLHQERGNMNDSELAKYFEKIRKQFTQVVTEDVKPFSVKVMVAVIVMASICAYLVHLLMERCSPERLSR